MSDGTDTDTGASLRTGGHVERAVLHHLAGAGPATTGELAETVGAVIERGGYGNLGPRSEPATVRRSSLRRTLSGLAEKGLVVRVAELSPDRLADAGLGEPDGDPADPGAYPATSDDGRVTDWLLTEAGRAEVSRLDARYEAALDEVAARHGRPRGETTDRVDA